MLDTNISNQKVENVFNDNPLDTGAPIAITFYKSQGQIGNYRNSIDYFG